MISSEEVTNQRLSEFTDSNAEKSLTISVKRLDLIHPVAGGNKFYKLIANIQYAKTNGFKQLITFGGPFSNHIAATAYVGHQNNIETIGVIRGEEPKIRSKTLRDAVKNGMKLQFISRKEYRNKNSHLWQSALLKEHGNSYIIPEGGTNELGVQGCEKILSTIDTHYDYVLVACGTGGTISGIIRTMSPNQEVIGIPVLNALPSIKENIEKYTNEFDRKNWQLIAGHTFGGYAKSDENLDTFIHNFENKTGIQIEKVYTAKLFHALKKLIIANFFRENSKILVIHTGGLQYIEP